MNLFRSEEHVARWLEAHGHDQPGETISAEKICELAHAWWASRLAPDWRPRTAEESQAILDRLGLTGEFWRLAPS
jgi:hypothetical protein